MPESDPPTGARSGTDIFEDARPRLLGAAYRMLGVVADAEDVVQEVWLRWRTADTASIERPEAWLTTVTCRLALDRLRSAQHRREHYVGPWLPEPVVLGGGPEEAAELADSLTYGFLVMLDELSPLERAVILMADVFGYSFGEIAQAVGSSSAACRQAASRARRRLERDGRRTASATALPPTEPSAREVIDGFLQAIAVGDVEGALARAAPGVVLVSDGGPERRAARRPVVGADRVVRLLTNLAQRFDEVPEVVPAVVNNLPGVVVTVGGVVDSAVAFEVREATVKAIWLVRNPAKLGHLGAALELA